MSKTKLLKFLSKQEMARNQRTQTTVLWTPFLTMAENFRVSAVSGWTSSVPCTGWGRDQSFPLFHSMLSLRGASLWPSSTGLWVSGSAVYPSAVCPLKAVQWRPEQAEKRFEDAKESFGPTSKDPEEVASSRLHKHLKMSARGAPSLRCWSTPHKR